jgi:hypothetical protein
MFHDYDPVTDRVYVGGAPRSPDDITFVFDCGVAHILRVDDVASDEPPIQAAVFQNRIYYLWNPCDDPITLTPPAKPLKWFEDSLHFAMPMLTQPAACVRSLPRWRYRGPLDRVLPDSRRLRPVRRADAMDDPRSTAVRMGTLRGRRGSRAHDAWVRQ